MKRNNDINTEIVKMIDTFYNHFKDKDGRLELEVNSDKALVTTLCKKELKPYRQYKIEYNFFKRKQSSIHYVSLSNEENLWGLFIKLQNKYGPYSKLAGEENQNEKRLCALEDGDIFIVPKYSDFSVFTSGSDLSEEFYLKIENDNRRYFSVATNKQYLIWDTTIWVVKVPDSKMTPCNSNASTNIPLPIQDIQKAANSYFSNKDIINILDFIEGAKWMFKELNKR